MRQTGAFEDVKEVLVCFHTQFLSCLGVPGRLAPTAFLVHPLTIDHVNGRDAPLSFVQEEALELMSAVQERGFLKSALLATSERNKFDDLKNRLQDAVSRLNLAATLEMRQLQAARFEQMDQVKARVEELGGADVVIQNPDALEEIQSSMEASDQLILASVSDSRKQLKTIGNEVGQTHWQTVQIAVEQKQHRLMAEQSQRMLEDSNAKLQKQDEKLDDVTQSFMKLQMEAELSRLQSEVLKRSDGTLTLSS